jgi:RNA polymerase sigma factor (sigma-70 family)
MDIVAATDRDIYERVAPALTRFAAALVGPDDAADVVSVVIVRVLAKRPLASIEKPESYLMQAVMNEAKTRSRGRHRRNAALVRIGPGHTARDTAELASSELTQIVMSLPHQQRAAIYLVYWCDYTPTEAAEAMGCEPGTVRRYLHLARKKLERFTDE